MHKGVLAWLFVFALHCGILEARDRSVIQASCNDDIELPCTARDHMVKYRYIVWFKDSIAIIKRKSNEVTIYNNSSPASLGVRETLVLQNVQPLDSGQYRCSLGADIGGRDMDSHVSFTVSECISASTVLTSTCPFTLEEVSDMWLLLFFLILGVAKVVICSTAIWVCKMQRGSAVGHRKEGKPRYRPQNKPMMS